MSGTVPFSELPLASVSAGDGSAVTARSERLKSQPKERTKKLPVPSGEVARAGVSYPGVAVARVRKSKVDKVDKVDSVDWPGGGSNLYSLSLRDRRPPNAHLFAKIRKLFYVAAFSIFRRETRGGGGR